MEIETWLKENSTLFDEDLELTADYMPQAAPMYHVTPSSSVTALAEAHSMGPLIPKKPRDETVTNEDVQHFIDSKKKINTVRTTERDIRNITEMVA